MVVAAKINIKTYVITAHSKDKQCGHKQHDFCHSCPVLPTTVLDSSDSLTLSFSLRRIQDSYDIPGSSLHVPLTQLPMLSRGSLGHPTGSHTIRRIPWTSQDPPLVSCQTQAAQAVRRIPWTSRDPPLESPHTQAPMLSGGSLGHPRILPWCPLTHRPMLSRGSHGHPGILPWCPLRHRPPCRPEDPLDILGSSLGIPLDTGLHAVRRIPWTSQDPPLVSLTHRPPCCPEDPLDIPGSSLGVPSDTGPHAVWRIPWTSRDPPLVSPHT